jgi:UDPglucose 6-dehydrogenase
MHAIIGSGVIGKATGMWLEANNEEVIFHDINSEPLRKLESKGYKVTMEESQIYSYSPDIIWICTAEWNVKDVIEKIFKRNKEQLVVVRSTTPPGTMEKLNHTYSSLTLVHNPEFLAQKTATRDIFNPDRVVFGTDSSEAEKIMKKLFSNYNCPIVSTDFTSSELIKYASNCWLATQISFWNEFKQLCDKFDVNGQRIVYASTLDKRISDYGTALTGEPFVGFCFPKDTKALIKSFKEKNLNPKLLQSVVDVNNKILEDGKK